MQKITESELKSRANRLREYMAIAEDNPGMGPYDAPAAKPKISAQTQLNPATSLNPAATAIPTGGLENPANQAKPTPAAGGQAAPMQGYTKTPPTAPKPPPASSIPKSVADLAAANGIKNPNMIQPGQQIKLPNGSTYTVAPGDNLSNISAGKFKGTPPAAPAAAGQNTGAGPEATKIAKFKELINKASGGAPAAAAPAPAAAGQAAPVDTSDPLAANNAGYLTPKATPAKESVEHFLNKLRMLESQLNEALTPEEADQLEALWTELGSTEQPSPEVAALINQYNALKKAGTISAMTTPAAKPTPGAGGQAAAPAAAPGMAAVGDDEGNTTITRPDGSTMVVGPDGKPYIPGSNPNLPQNQDKRSAWEKFAPNFLGGKDAPKVPNAQTTSPWQTASGKSQPAPAAPAPTPGTVTSGTGIPVTSGSGAPVTTKESVGFRNDELTRIINLVHHR